MKKRNRARVKSFFEVYSTYVKKMRTRVARVAKSSFFRILSIVSKGNRRLIRQTNPSVMVILKRSKKFLKVSKSRLSVLFSFLSKKKKQFSFMMKTIRSAMLSLIYRRSPRFYEYVLDKGASYRQVKKTVKRYIGRKTSNKSSRIGKLHDFLYDMKILYLSLNPFQKKRGFTGHLLSYRWKRRSADQFVFP